MAKKTVLKKALKYAPMKSDFARRLAADGTVKDELSDDMFDIAPVYIETEGVVVSADSGEVSGDA